MQCCSPFVAFRLYYIIIANILQLDDLKVEHTGNLKNSKLKSKQDDRKKCIDISADVFIGIFCFMTRIELANSLQLVCRRINQIIERNFNVHPKLIFRQLYPYYSQPFENLQEEDEVCT